MKKINTDFIRLQDILQAINDIEDYKISDLNSKMLLHAVLYDIAVIGETANKISLSFKQQNSTVPWAAIINMRHRIVHDYGNINIQAVKEVLDNDLPILKQQIVDMLKILSS